MMNKVGKMAPELRFPEFTDDWEQCKLGDIAGTTYGGGTPKTSVDAYWNGEIPWIQSSNLSEDELFNANIQKGITNQGLQKSAAQLVPGNSIAVVSHVGVGKLVYMPFQYTTSQDFISLSELKSDPIFTCYALYRRLQKDLHIVQGSAIKGITKEDLLSKNIIMPNLEEQKKIGITLQSLDNLITLHQRKLDSMNEYKKGLLQKMFPKKGEKVPELRFPGFTDDWELRKCEGILKPIKGAMKIGPFGSALKKEFYTETGVKVYAQENIFQEDFTIGDYYISEERYQTLKGCKLEAGDLVISMMGTIGACAIFPDNAEPGIMNSHLLRLQLNYDIYPEYIHQLLRDSQTIRDQIDRLSVGTIMSGLSSSVVKKLVFPIPSINEQKMIAELLMQIDKTITLHQRKLDNMKEYKKGLLQKMFV